MLAVSEEDSRPLNLLESQGAIEPGVRLMRACINDIGSADDTPMPSRVGRPNVSTAGGDYGKVARPGAEDCVPAESAGGDCGRAARPGARAFMEAEAVGGDDDRVARSGGEAFMEAEAAGGDYGHVAKPGARPFMAAEAAGGDYDKVARPAAAPPEEHQGRAGRIKWAVVVHWHLWHPPWQRR